jgi:flagellar hook-basal body complex protein FliE
MRIALALLSLTMVTAPAVAQQPARAPVQLPPELTDPATAQRLTNVMQALSNAFLNVKVGGVEAAIEGREAGPREKNLTVRDMARRDDPNFDRNLQRQIAQVGPTMQSSMNALNQALPEVMQSLHEAKKSIERAAANMPDPTYPNR